MPAIVDDKPELEKLADLEQAVLSVARQLVAEVHAQRGDLEKLSIDSDITKDLGLDSLARVELFSRLSKQLNVTLSEQLFSNAVTLKDLLPEISKGFTVDLVAGSLQQKVVPSAGELLPTPESARTLVDVLDWYVEREPERPHIQLYDDEKPGDTISNAQLFSGAQSVAAGLQALGIGIQQPVAIMLPTSEDYFYSFFGILLAGCIPVPLYPPARPAQLEDHIRRHTSILSNCRASLLITVPEAKNVARLLKSHVESVKHIVTVAELSTENRKPRFYKNSAQDIAFIQYTSGSTGTPKGVVLSHHNLLANIRAMGETVKANSNDVFVSWLPLYHDMGLIGAWLGSLYYGARFVVMSPLAFLTRPQRWLWAIHRYGGTLSASPNFGYEFCLRRIEDKEIENLDLSSWRAAFNGAETVSPETVEKFCDRFQAYGFRRQAYMPVYGLAENSVGLAFPPLNQGPLIDYIQRDAFMQAGRAIPVDVNDKTAIKFVACGQVLKRHNIRIVDNAGRELPNRQEGRLQFQGPSATVGYFDNPVKTAELIKDGWLDSGDLAYIANGNVYLTGRTKDIIIRGGRNIYPHELEEVVGNIEGIRNGRVAAFGSKEAQSGTERLVILAETRETDQQTLSQLRAEVNERVNDLVGLPPDEVVLAPPNSVLKTSSGKIRRAACKALFEKGAIGKGGHAVWLQVARLWLSGFVSQWRSFLQTSMRVLYGWYGRIMFWLLAPLAWLLVAVLPALSWRWAVMRWSTRLLAFVTATPLSVTGKRNLPPEKQTCIYVCNHASYMDGPYVITLLGRQFSFIAKAELSQQFVSRTFLNRIHAIYVERFDIQQGVADFQQLAHKVKAGESLFFFPEGTFMREEGLLPFHMGAFITAAETNVPVVPITINGSRQIFRAEEWLPRHGAIAVSVGKTIDPADCPDSSDTWACAVWLRDQARQQILRDLHEPDLGSR